MSVLRHPHLDRVIRIIGIMLAASLLGPAAAMPMSTTPDWIDFEAQLEIEITREQNFDLAPPQSDTLHVLRPEFQLEAWIKPWPGIEGFFVLEMAHAFDLQDGVNNDELSHAEFSLKEAFITLPSLGGTPLSIQVGRQTLEDERQWWYDDELDAMRLVFQLVRFRLEATLARFALVDEDLANRQGTDDTVFYHLYAHYTFGPFLTLAAYGIILNDDTTEEGEDERPAFVGLRARGEFEPGWRYWLDAAHVRGKSEGQRLRGWGLNINVLYEFDLVAQPLLILGYAFGSGDNTPESSTNTSFRQTGLHSNATPYESVTDVQYYGELFDPELSNLHIFTIGLGFQPVEDASVTVLYHVYRQATQSDEFRDVAIDAEPNGLSRDVGSEVDVIGGWELEPVELKLIVGAFFPGNAFEPETQNAYFAEFRLAIEF